MPRPALRQPDHRQPAAAEQAVLGSASTAYWLHVGLNRHVGIRIGETVWRYSSMRKIDDACGRRSRDRRHQRATPVRGRVRRRAVRSSCSSRAEIACLLLGSARMTTRSPASSSSTIVRATCRSRRATRCRCTAVPTDFETTRPIRGPSPKAPSEDTQRMHDEIGLNRSHPLADRGAEVRGPRHPVPRRKHDAKIPRESRSERATTLAAPVRHDRATRARAHPQPESVHACTTPVVRLKSPLALGHGCSLLVAPGIRTHHR